MNIGIEYGALADKIETQLTKQGVEFEQHEINACQGLADADTESHNKCTCAVWRLRHFKS